MPHSRQCPDPDRGPARDDIDVHPDRPIRLKNYGADAAENEPRNHDFPPLISPGSAGGIRAGLWARQGKARQGKARQGKARQGCGESCLSPTERSALRTRKALIGSSRNRRTRVIFRSEPRAGPWSSSQFRGIAEAAEGLEARLRWCNSRRRRKGRQQRRREQEGCGSWIGWVGFVHQMVESGTGESQTRVRKNQPGLRNASRAQGLLGRLDVNRRRWCRSARAAGNGSKGADSGNSKYGDFHEFHGYQWSWLVREASHESARLGRF